MTWSDSALNVKWLPCPGDVPVDVPMLCGCFLAMRREIFDKTGGFDDGLVRWGAEDLEISVRLWTLGYRCLIVPGVAVTHLFRERFPYEISPQSVLTNLLRVALVHLTGPRLAAVVSCLRLQRDFPAALAGLYDGDISQRSIQIRSERVRDDAWYVERFAICLDAVP
jgi:GT2 family glycosyltransferase